MAKIKIHPLFLLGLIIIFIYYSPYFILGKDAFLPPEVDGLSLLPFVISGKYLFSSNETIVPYILGGIPRYVFYPELYYVTLLFNYFDPFWAWAINSVFMSVVGLIGAFLFFKDYGKIFLSKIGLPVPDHKIIELIAWIIGIYYATIPNWIYGGLSIKGMPLVVWVLLNIHYKNKLLLSWLIVILYSFFSNFYYFGMYFYAVLALVIFVYQVYKRKILLSVNLALLILILFGLSTYYRFFLVDSLSQNLMHRLEGRGREIREGLTLWQHIKETILMAWENKFFFFVPPGAETGDGVFVALLFSVISFYLLLKRHFFYLKILILVTLIPYVLLTISTNPAIFKTPLAYLFPAFKPFIGSISIRFIYLSFFVLLIIYFILLIVIYFSLYRARELYIILIVSVAYQLVFSCRAKRNNHAFGNNYIYRLKPSYNDFFDEELFHRIKTYIFNKYSLSPEEYKVLSVVNGKDQFIPCIAQINHFHTIDGYLPYVPDNPYLIFKKIRNYYKNLPTYGYNLISSHIRIYLPVSTDGIFPVPPEAFKEFKTSKIFIFSTQPIFSPYQINFEKVFIGNYWRIYLYRMDLQ